MKKNLIAKITTLSLVCALSIGTVSALALGGPINSTTLTEEQKVALESERAELQAKHESFYNSLSENQKVEFDSLSSKRYRVPLTEEQQAALELERTERQAKIDAFYNTLSDSQKQLFDAAKFAKPNDGEKLVDGEKRIRPTAEEIATITENREAFINSLSETQKAEFETICNPTDGSRGFGGKLDRKTLSAQ